MTIGRLAGAFCALTLLVSSHAALSRTICYVTAADSHPYATPANEALDARAKELGIRVLSLSQNFNVQTGVQQLNTCIARRVSGIILWPLDPQAYSPGLVRAKAAGIPVDLINTPMGPQAQPYYVSFTGPDVYSEGRMAADAMNTALNGRGSIVIIAGQAGNGTTIGRVDGFLARLKELNSGIKVLDTVNADFDQKKALVVSRDLITRFGNQINGVYANDDTMARGFIDAWRESNQTKQTPIIVGINGQKDAFASIESGEMYATIVQSPAQDGRVAMDTMAAILSGKQVQNRVPIPLTVVTKENVTSKEPAF
jgi:ribose transport system substrate-binding protein